MVPTVFVWGHVCSLDDMREQGTNIMFTANGNQRFEILNVVQSALPSMPFGDIYPTVDDLVEQYVEDYSRKESSTLRAEIRLLDEVGWRNTCRRVVRLFSKIGLNISSMSMPCFRNEDIDLEQMVLILDEEFLPYDTPSLWQVANAVLDKQEDRQSALSSSTSSEDVFSVLQQALREKNAQLNFIRALE